MTQFLEEYLVREYFEINGFLVRNRTQSAGSKRRRKGRLEFDLEVIHPEPLDGPCAEFQIFTSELKRLGAALVKVFGWDESGFTPRMLRNGKQLVDHLRKHVLKGLEPLETVKLERAAELRLWVLPGLPSVDPHRGEAVSLLRELGVDHALTFRTVLDNLAQNVDPTNDYPKSQNLRLIRLLKIFEMVSPPQMDLFQKGKVL